ncbi:hypothetical protein BMF94_5542 [Rhodotorula taiwanensis]|uniref:Isochorismatase-like domain-containing protein n=1 Tax=Rhodotorula taiwanensis TaxID=741276 RepID=A0A2S5B384_9BASI|nr:hypothetical protein BMF94_5542 [Rhodotorula taiwanensis]
MSRIHRLVPSKTAFFACDLQERFRLIVHSYPSVLKTAEKMVKAALIMECPVIASQQAPRAAPPGENPDASMALVDIGETVPLPLHELPSPILRPSWVPFVKTKFSMVVPEVEKQLKEWDTKSVVLFGIETHVCVLQTAFDLLERGIDVHVLADGTSSANGDEVGLAIKRMRDSGAQITTSESILYQIMRDSAHPGFKALTGLIREYDDSTRDSLQHLIGGRGF